MKKKDSKGRQGMQLDPLTSKSDKHVISPHSITLLLGSLE